MRQKFLNPASACYVAVVGWRHDLAPYSDGGKLLLMAPADVGRIMLFVAKEVSQSAGFTYEAITSVPVGAGMTLEYESGYPFHKQQKVNDHLNKAWRLLERDGYINPLLA